MLKLLPESQKICPRTNAVLLYIIDIDNAITFQIKLGTTNKRVKNHDYLGVTISSDINWIKHATKISNKTSRADGLPYPPAHKT